MDDIRAAEVLDQLERIMQSRVFARSERMRQFLTFIVNESLAGHVDTLKETVIAHHVYGRSIDALGAGDSIVRVDARRLRDKLREYYANHPGDPIAIELPKGGYAPNISRRNVVSTGGEADATRRSLLRPGVMVFFLVSVLVAGSWWLWSRYSASDTEEADRVENLQGRRELREVPVTSYVGHEIHPSLSPDGSQLAFAWDGGGSNGVDIYVKVVGEDQALQLTATDDVEMFPSWSPDGRWIAFVRESRTDSPGIFVIAPLGGAERRVTDNGYDVSWSPDSASILFSIDDGEIASGAIYHLTIGTRTREQLTFPAQSAVDFSGALAPNGNTLAFIRCATPARHNCDAFIKGPDPRDRAWRLTEFDLPMSGLAWTPDGQHLVFSAAGELFRTEAARGAEPRRLGFEGTAPSVAAAGGGARLAFQRHRADTSIWQTEILFDDASEPVSMGRSVKLIDSTRRELNPVVSPDGQMIVFASNRSGPWIAWAADADGGGVRLFSEHINGQFAWSPTGTHVAGLCVDAEDDRNDICVVAADTGNSVLLAPSTHVDGMPSWSADGDEIYFASDRSGRPEIWKAAITETEPTQVTDHGALAAAMSVERNAILYYPDTDPSPGNWAKALWRLSLDSGAAEKLLDRVYPFAHVDASNGLFWLDFADSRNEPPEVRFLSGASGESRSLGRLPHRIFGLFPDLSITPDESRLLTVQAEDGDTDILIVDDFL